MTLPILVLAVAAHDKFEAGCIPAGRPDKSQRPDMEEYQKMSSPLLLREQEPIAPPDYPILTNEAVLRPLDPTEWNMERLNRVSNGAGCVYQIVQGRGSLREARLRDAVNALTQRHPLLGTRIVREDHSSEAALLFVRAGAPQVVFAEVDGLGDRYLEIIEADMNAGPTPSWRSSPFRFICLTDAADPERWMLVVAGSHACCDGISLACLAHELLLAVSTGGVGDTLALRSIEIGQLPDRKTETSGPSDVRVVAPEVAVPAEPGRRSLVRTKLKQVSLTHEDTKALMQAVKRNGLTAHGAIGAAAHLALAARHAELTGTSPYGVYSAGSPVSIRSQVAPPLSDADIRMAVDVALTNITVSGNEGFWSLARRFGVAVREQIDNGDILRSWRHTTRKDRELGSTGVPLPLISNVGRSVVQSNYGQLSIENVAGAMATHGMFQIAMLFTTFDDRLGACFYAETPTVSEASVVQVMRRTINILASQEVHEGNPSNTKLLGTLEARYA